MEHNENPGRLYYLNNINSQLARLGVWVESANKTNHTDIAVVSEDIVGGLLNLVFRDDGWKLTNVNTPASPNFPGIDLADENLCIAVQVTSNNTLGKVKDMLEKFSSHQLDRQFDHLILVELTSADATPGMKKQRTAQFDGEKDIWNITYLMRQIQDIQDVDHLECIARYLEQQIGDLYSHLESPLNTAKLAFTLSPKNIHFLSLRRTIIITCIIFIISIFILAKPFSRMPDEISKYEITINGTTVSVPTTFENLQSLGWYPVDPDRLEDNVTANTISSNRIELTNGHGEFTVMYMNPSPLTMKSSDCIIYSLIFTESFFGGNSADESPNTLDTPLGLRVGINNWSDYRSYSYIPKIRKDEHTVAYCFGTDTNHSYILRCDKESKLLKGIEIHCTDYSNLYYIPSYILCLATDSEGLFTLLRNKSVNIHIDGFDYPVMCAVRDYQNMNYVVDSTSEYMLGNQYADVCFQISNFHKAYCQVYNLSPNAASLLNCYICSISTENISPRTDPFIFTCETSDYILNISEGMTQNELITALNECDIQWSESDNGITFYPYPNLNTLYAICYLNSDGLVTDLSVDGCQALQDTFQNREKIIKALQDKLDSLQSDP